MGPFFIGHYCHTVIRLMTVMANEKKGLFFDVKACQGSHLFSVTWDLGKHSQLKIKRELLVLNIFSILPQSFSSLSLSLSVFGAKKVISFAVVHWIALALSLFFLFGYLFICISWNRLGKCLDFIVFIVFGARCVLSMKMNCFILRPFSFKIIVSTQQFVRLHSKVEMVHYFLSIFIDLHETKSSAFLMVILFCEFCYLF